MNWEHARKRHYALSNRGLISVEGRGKLAEAIAARNTRLWISTMESEIARRKRGPMFANELHALNTLIDALLIAEKRAPRPKKRAAGSTRAQ